MPGVRLENFFTLATLDQRLLITDCASCGIVFAIPENLYDRRSRDGQSFFCPNGHNLSYREDEATRQRKRADKLERSLANSRESERAAYAAATVERERLAAEKRQHAATKGTLTKTRKRAVGGVCPCCPRSFVDVKRHMARMHPDQAVVGLGDGTTEVAAT